jgi:hypothetical protein
MYAMIIRMLVHSAISSAFAISLLSLETHNRAFSQYCYPSDPGGNNPQNPCPVYPPPGIRSDSFISGHARPIRRIPTVINPSGRIIAAPTGYWSGSQTEDGVRSVKTSQGKTYRFKSQ